MKNMFLKSKVMASVLAVVMVGSMFTACSTANKEDEETVASTQISSEDEAKLIEELEKKLEPYYEVPEFKTDEYDLEPFDAVKLMEGKKWLTIPGSSANPFNQTVCQAMSEVGTKLGFTYDVLENQGTAEEHIAGLNSAAQKGYSLVDLQAGPTPETLGAQIQDCMDSGVKVVASHLTGYEQEISPISGNMAADYYEIAKMLVDWVIINAGTDAKVLCVVSEEVTSTLSMINGAKDEFKELAPNAKVDFVNVAIVDWSTKCQSETENYLSAHPDTEYIISMYDSATQYIVPAVKSTGSSAKIIAYNGTPFAVDYVNTGELEMVIGEDLQTIAYSSVDYEMRVALGMEEVVEPTLFRIWTKDNVSEALNSKGKCEYGIGYGTSAKEAYEEIWGLSK